MSLTDDAVYCLAHRGDDSTTVNMRKYNLICDYAKMVKLYGHLMAHHRKRCVKLNWDPSNPYRLLDSVRTLGYVTPKFRSMYRTIVKYVY